jgi:hypothetical protein
MTADLVKQDGQALEVPEMTTLPDDGEGLVIEDRLVLSTEELSEAASLEEQVGRPIEELDQTGEARETTIHQQLTATRPGSSVGVICPPLLWVLFAALC